MSIRCMVYASLLACLIVFSQIVMGTNQAFAQGGLFGSKEVRNVNPSLFPKWAKILEYLRFDKGVQSGGCIGAHCGNGHWMEFVRSQKSNSDLQILKEVHRYVNSIRYIEDKKLWGKGDYWALPEEFFAKGGDCEDYAIAKYVMLRKLGFKKSDMRIVVVKDKYLGEIHSVLTVKLNGKTYVLDNKAALVLKMAGVSHYLPIYSINESYWWQHLA